MTGGNQRISGLHCIGGRHGWHQFIVRLREFRPEPHCWADEPGKASDRRRPSGYTKSGPKKSPAVNCERKVRSRSQAARD